MNLKINISANKALFNLKQSSANLVKDLSKLSSGNKITSPEDDSAGLSQVIRMEAELKRNNAVQSNLANFVSLIQTQNGILAKATEAIKRMSELSILAQDIVKAEIISHINGTIHGSIDSQDLGVLFTKCRKCFGIVVKMRDAVKCKDCGWIDDRKLSTEFGKSDFL